MQVVQELSSNLIVIEKLQSFQYKDPNMRDHGENVRHRAKQLCELVMDPERVREERKKVMLWSISCNGCVWGRAVSSGSVPAVSVPVICEHDTIICSRAWLPLLLQAKDLKSKYTGVSSDMMRTRQAGSSTGGSGGEHQCAPSRLLCCLCSENQHGITSAAFMLCERSVNS